jgi:hypothetical protein
VVRGTPYNEDPVTAIFETSGLYQQMYLERYECLERTGVYSKQRLDNSDPQPAPTPRKTKASASPIKKVIHSEKHSVAGLQNNSLFDSDDPTKEPFSVPLANLQKHVNAMSSSDGITYRIETRGRVMDLDLVSIPGDTSLAAVTRTIFIIGRLAQREYDQISFSDRGKTLFTIEANKIQKIGRQFLWGERNKGQNPIALIRQFAGAVIIEKTGQPLTFLNGSLLGDTTRSNAAMNNVFNRQWVIDGDTIIK